MKEMTLRVELSGQDNSKWFLIFTIILFILPYYLFSQNDDWGIPPLSDCTNEKEYARKWEKYGAYYDKYEMTLSPYFYWGRGIMRTIYKTSLEYNITLKILTVEGAKHGTIPISKYSDHMSGFEVSVYDSTNKKIPLNMYKFRSNYLQTGKLVFPKVIPGSTIKIKIKFSDSGVPISFRCNFAHSIPVRVGRFVLKTTNTRYESITYGNRAELKQEIYKSGRGSSWVLENLEPRKDLDYMDFECVTEPRIVLRLLELKDIKKKYNTIDSIFSSFNQLVENTTKDFNKRAFDPFLKEIVGKTDNQLDKAKNILRWLQDSISSTGYSGKELKSIIKQRKASDLQIACLCNKMYREVGLVSNILIARSKNKLIINKSFPFYDRYYSTMLPVVTIENKTYVVYPYAKGYALGEYPLSYQGVYCYDLQDESINIIPRSMSGKNWKKTKSIIDLSTSPYTFHINFEYRQNQACRMRNNLLYDDKAGHRRYMQNIIHNYNKANKLVSYSFEKLENYEKPLIVNIEYQPEVMPIKYENKQIYKLTDFFDDYFEDITLDRTEDVFIHYDYTYIDELEISKVPGKKLTLQMKKQFGSQKYFTVNYSELQTDTSYLFTRTIQINENHIPKEQIKDFHNDCVKLNEIKNSTVIIE